MITWSKKKKRRPMSLVSASTCALVILLSLSGCKGIEKSVGESSEATVTRVETMVPYPVPADSLLVRAFLECDSLNNVLVRSLVENKTKNMVSAFSLSNGVLTYKAKTERDSAWVKQVEEIADRSKITTIKETKMVYKKGFFFWSGVSFWALLTGFLAIKISGAFRI